ncbi:MAG: septum formation initiator family protein [Actinomycetota bacterium]|nr:septum formation initiator family protein [Actinomycetota bacterium]
MPSARPATAAPRRSPHTPPPRPRGVPLPPTLLRVRWDRAGRVGLLVVLVVVVGLYVQHTLAYLSVSAQASRQEEIVDQLARQNARLAAEQRSLNQPATIVRDARALGMVRPGERAYVITGHTGH